MHWPPLVHALEGFVFLLVGPSVISARVTILIFTGLALLYFYALAKYLTDRWTAMVGMLFLAFMPTMVLFAKLVMLEIPCLAFCLASAFYLARYAREHRAQDVYLSAVAAALALLTKQNAVFLPLFALLYLVASRHSRAALRLGAGIRWMGVLLVITGPYYALMAWTHWETIALDLGEEHHSSVRGALWYLAAIPTQTGLILLACGVAGLIVVIVHRQYAVLAFSTAWIASCLLVMSLIGHKEPRYVMYWLPAFALLAAAPFGAAITSRFRRPQVIAASLVLIVVTIKAATFERPYVVGYEEVAKQLTALTSHGIVLVDDLAGYGTLIFFGNVMDPRRQLYFHRKALYAVRWKKEGGYTNLVSVPQDVDRLVNDHGISYLVHAENGPIHFEGQRVLRDYLRIGRFIEVSRVQIQTNLANWRNRQIVIYQNQSPTAPVADSLRIRNLHLGQDIVVPTFNPR